MAIAQRIVAVVFAAFLWLVAFSAFESYNEIGPWLALAALLAGMALVLWALRPRKP